MTASASAQKKTTPAKKTTAPTTPAALALDFTKLVVTDVDASKVKHTRKSDLDNSPVLDWLRVSKADGTVKAVEVLAAQAPAFVNTLRQAAARLEIGVAVKVEPAEDGKVSVNFKGKEKTKRKLKVKAEAPKAE